MTLQVPVVLLMFNRPHLAERVFAAIAQVRPPRLLVVADGPRTLQEERLCDASRGILNRVDWRCDVRTLFATSHLGCRKRVASGLDWAFGECDAAVILEDDCVPDPSFFHFCEELLIRYADDPRVMHISGGTTAPCWPSHWSYRFSAYPTIWGWASWRRAWRYYDEAIAVWPSVRETSFLNDLFVDDGEAAHWRRRLDKVYMGHNTWDHQWSLAMWLQGGLAVAPNVNLVQNIGFGADATHTRNPMEALSKSIPARQMGLPLKHPPEILRDAAADRAVFRSLNGSRPGRSA
jgi:hypothetical protein